MDRRQAAAPEGDDEHGKLEGATTLAGAIKTIIVADAVMSLDNVIAVAGAAKGDMNLVVFGILVSIPIVVWGSQLVLKLMDRFPLVITLGAGLLGWIGGSMIVTDIWLQPYVKGYPSKLYYVTAAMGAALVVGVGTWLARRHAPTATALVDLADDSHSSGRAAH